MTSTTTPLRARTRRVLAAAATTGVTVAALVGLAPAAQARRLHRRLHPLEAG